MKRSSIWIGYDPREDDGFIVTRNSILRRSTAAIPVHALVLDELKRRQLFWRQQESRDGKIWDVISEAYCATEFSISRFLVPFVADREDEWAIFVDCDMLCLGDVAELVALCDPRKAVMVAKHDFAPPEGTKMDGQVQTAYARKNWSSVMAFNLRHPGIRRMTLDMVNDVPGRFLHAFHWLHDHEIGDLPLEWNWLVGHSAPVDQVKMAHFTDGIPSMSGHEGAPFADEWRRELQRAMG